MLSNCKTKVFDQYFVSFSTEYFSIYKNLLKKTYDKYDK